MQIGVQRIVEAVACDKGKPPVIGVIQFAPTDHRTDRLARPEVALLPEPEELHAQRLSVCDFAGKFQPAGQGHRKFRPDEV
jgi:hypothetical protein